MRRGAYSRGTAALALAACLLIALLPAAFATEFTVWVHPLKSALGRVLDKRDLAVVILTNPDPDGFQVVEVLYGDIASGQRLMFENCLPLIMLGSTEDYLRRIVEQSPILDTPSRDLRRVELPDGRTPRELPVARARRPLPGVSRIPGWGGPVGLCLPDLRRFLSAGPRSGLPQHLSPRAGRQGLGSGPFGNDLGGFPRSRQGADRGGAGRGRAIAVACRSGMLVLADAQCSTVNYETPIVKTLIAVWGLGALIITLAAAWGQGQFMAQLQYRHAAVWRALGRPRLLASDNTLQSLFRLYSYIASADYRALGDRQMSLYGETMRYAFLAFIVWFIGGILLLLFSPRA